MKKLLLFVLMLLPMVASADKSGKCGDNVYYTYNSTNHTLTIYGEGAIWSNMLPEPGETPWIGLEISGVQSVIIKYGVTSISRMSFIGFRSMTSITIPNSVTSIEREAFMECSSLTSISIPNSVISIRNDAFDGCFKLASIIVEDGNLYYDSRNNCNAIIETSTNTLIIGSNNTIIPKGVTSIGSGAFSGCSQTSVNIPSSVTSIGNGAFSGCSLTSVTIPSSVTSIGNGAFSGCGGLTSIKVESGNQTYDSRNNCNAIIKKSSNTLIAGCKNTIIPNSVTSIGELAFRGCSLTSVTIPSSVTFIGDWAFAFCRGLNSITIPNSVKSIGQEAFYGCSGLTSVTIPSSVTSIGSSVFSGCSGLTSVNIPQNVTSIGYNAFYGCSGLIYITLPSKLISIGEGAFQGCSGLTSITIPQNITSIGYKAFYGCSGLTSINIPNSVTSIGYGAFWDCSSLKTVISEIEDPFAVDNVDFYGIPSNATLIVPKGTKAAYLQSGWGWNQFANIVEAGGSTTLTDNGINFALKDDGTLEVIGLETWARIADILSDVTIGGRTYRVTSIKAWAFEGRSDLLYLSIPWTVTSIGEYAFIDCGSNITVNIADPECWCQMQLGNEHASPLSSAGRVLVHDIETTSIDIPKTVTSIGKFTFYQCRKIKSLNIPSSVKSIGSSAFEDCTGLTALTLSEGLQSVGGSAFEGCTGLKSLTIPSTVNTIKLNAFKNCTGLTDVYCYAESVPSTNASAFEGSYVENVTLHVAKGCSGAYKAKEPWKNFKNIVETVDAKVKLSKTKAAIEKGKTLTLKATITPSDLADKSVTWKSSNTKVATVTSKGKVKGVKVGTATITCTSKATGAKATCKVTVGYVKLDKTEAIINKGKTMTLKATVYPSTLTDRSVSWKSSNTKIATVSSKGKVKGVKAGTATITCTSNATGLKTTCKVTVGYVKLDQTEVTVKKGKTVTLKAAVYPSTLDDKSVTWESSNTKVATVSSKGKVKGIKAGLAVITCTSNATGLSTTCIVTVKATSGTRSLEGDDDDEVTEIDEVEASAAIKPFDVYDLSGRKVLHQMTSLDGLSDGIYIVNGKKILKKK